MQENTIKNEGELVRQSVDRLGDQIELVKLAGMIDLKPKATDALDKAFKTIVLQQEFIELQSARINTITLCFNDLVDRIENR